MGAAGARRAQRPNRSALALAPLGGMAAVTSDSRSFGLDLLRFLAIGGVLVTHCGVVFAALYRAELPKPAVMPAFFGVELFFVLSGFLIGGLLLDIIETAPSPRAWAVFMVRRWLRTLPAYYVWLALLPLLLPVAAGSRHLLTFATMTQNLAWPMPIDGFFGVSWSLAIEEWFYLLFSAALIGAVGLLHSRSAAWPVIVAFMLVPAFARLMVGMPADYVGRVYHVVVFRLDAIAWGVAMAKLHRERRRMFEHPMLCVGLGLAIVALVWTLQFASAGSALGHALFLRVHLPLTSVGLCLCLAAALRLRPLRGRVGRLISFGARISYGIYLTHLTIIEVVVNDAVAHNRGPAFAIATILVLMLLIPWLLFRFFESPILALRPPQFPKGLAIHRAPLRLAEGQSP
jgi:peptidoglycan/LPS O-acetylase OafA/YrhL